MIRGKTPFPPLHLFLLQKRVVSIVINEVSIVINEVSIVINEREHVSIFFVFLPLTKMYRYLGDFCYTCLGYKSG